MIYKILNKTKGFVAVNLIFCLLAACVPVKAQAISAKAYALIDQSSCRVILSGNENTRLPMASTTKIMTGLIAVESGRLDETVTVPAEALRVEGSSMGLVAGEKLTLRELVYGLMLESGNDAANSIAQIIGGTSDKFVKKMNAKAQKLGLSNTHFCNPSGLGDKDHYTSALDLARLAAYAMNNAEFAKIVSTKKIRVSYNGVKNGRCLSNHNSLLGCYDGALGVKTGFTKKSGRCLVSCARRNGVELIAVTLNDPNDWKDHKELLDCGFKVLKSTKLMETTPQYTADVVGGTADKVPVYYDGNVTAALENGELECVKMSVQIDRFYYAPIKKDQVLGKIVFTLDGKTIAQTDIKSSQDVAVKTQQHGFFQSIISSVKEFFANLFG